MRVIAWLIDLLALEHSALCALSDNGTVQEECCNFRATHATMRDVAARPETIDRGTNTPSGCEPDVLSRCVDTVLSQPRRWQLPATHLPHIASSTAAGIASGRGMVK
jgi:UDP-N-acetylglucosamine 2-epimerase (non-hydrolysing)